MTYDYIFILYDPELILIMCVDNGFACVCVSFVFLLGQLQHCITHKFMNSRQAMSSSMPVANPLKPQYTLEDLGDRFLGHLGVSGDVMLLLEPAKQSQALMSFWHVLLSMKYDRFRWPTGNLWIVIASKRAQSSCVMSLVHTDTVCVTL